MSSSLDHKCQRCGSQHHGQVCPFCTITGLDVNALLASEGLSSQLHTAVEAAGDANEDGSSTGEVTLIDVVSKRGYPLNNPICRFGRDISNDVVLTGDKSLSRFHFQVTIVNDEYFVEDAGSRNGSFLNGAPVTAPKKLVNGDIISAGMSRYRFVNGVDLGGGELSEEEQAQHAQAQLDDPKATGEVSLDFPAQAAKDTPQPAELHKEYGNLNSPFKSKESNGHGELDARPMLPGQTQPEPDERPVEELFQQQIRAAAAAREQESEAPPPAFPSQPATLQSAPVEALQPSAASPAPAVVAPAQCQVRPAGPRVEPTQRTWPAWCTQYSFAEMDEIRSSMSRLELEIKDRQAELAKLSTTIAQTEDLRNRILATANGELVDACSMVFGILGFSSRPSSTCENELILSVGDTATAIAKIVSTDSQPRPADLASLVSSLSNYWCENGIEPKGILVVSMLTEGQPDKRPALVKDFVDYALKKNVCLISTVQLLSIYRDIALRGSPVESIRGDVLAASGQISGH